MLRDRLSFSASTAKQLLFVGHYPLHATEVALCESIGLEEMLVYPHMDMPLLQVFGAERIKELIANLGGWKEDEPLTVMSSATSHAQEKIAKSVLAEITAQSEDEWMKINAEAVK